MDTFDLGRLTDFDFESVCKDLFESVMRIQLEIFTPGKDSGTDLRHMSNGNSSALIIQCKNWERSKRSSLISHMSRVELPKINALHPERYVLATSVALSVQAKDRLVKVLTPYVRSASDIYGLHEIEALLRERPEIVSRHLRLWLSSAQVLQALLNKKILTRSTHLAGDIRDAMLVYVPNQSYARARDILEEHHVCIVAGIPGIGKTTLAQVLAASYAASNYEVYEISEDADEINSVWNDRIPQFFYYDDFLGQNTLDDKLHKNEDSRLLRLLGRVNGSTNKRIVMTTREYILEQARLRYERIDRANFNPWTCVLSLGYYTSLIRAEILYNHVHFSNLTVDDKAIFADLEVYSSIIHHVNFNPRLIEYSISLSVAESHSGEQAAQTIRESLANPRTLWEHIIQNQLDQLSVDVLTSMFLSKRSVGIDRLTRRLQRYRAAKGESFTSTQFRRSLKILEGTMLRTSKVNDVPVASYHSPSIADYMRNRIFGAKEVLHNLIRAVSGWDEIENLTVYIKLDVAHEALQDSEIKASLSTAIIRAYHHDERLPEKIADRDEVYGRSATALDIANIFNLSDVAGAVKEWICSIRLSEVLPPVDEVADLIRKVYESTFPEVQSLLEGLLEEGIDYILEDTNWDWDNAKAAQSALNELGSLVPQWATDHIEQNLSEIAERALDRVAESGEYYNQSELEEIVEYADSYARAEEHFVGLEDAKDIIERKKAMAEPSEVRVPVVPVNHESRRIDAEVHKVMSMLRQTP